MTEQTTPLDDRQPAARRGPGVLVCAAALLALGAALGLLGRHADPRALWSGGAAAKAGGVVGAAVLGTLVWAFGGFLYRTLTSLPFAVAILTLLLLATILGTLVIQGAPPEVYAKKYGAGAAAGIQGLGLDDLFHSRWYVGWLALLAVSLVLVPIRRKAWRRPQWGHGLAHLGVVSVLAGCWIGVQWGYKGHLQLHEGESADAAFRWDARRRATDPHPLGFSVRLDDFEIEYYPLEYRFYVTEEGKRRPVKSIKREDATTWKTIGRDDTQFRVLREFPDLRLRLEVEAVPPGQGVPALQLDYGKGGDARRIILLAGMEQRDAVDLAPLQGPRLSFRWDPPADPEIARWTESTPERHLLARMEGDKPEEEVSLPPAGQSVVVGGAWQVRVLGYYPDFVVDPATRKPSTRSPRPNNPAVQVEVTPAGGGPAAKRLLYAHFPEFNHGEGAQVGPRLEYRYVPAYAPAPREIVVVGRSRESWELENGRVLRRTPLPAADAAWEAAPGIRARLFPSARERHVPVSASDEWKNPAAEVELKSGDKTWTELLPAFSEEAVPLPDPKRRLAFRLRQEIKDYWSTLSILEEGRPVLSKRIEVNDPLEHRGYWIYQADYREDDPTFSGLQVVRDPGLPFVWGGLLGLCAGVVWIFYGRPRKGRAAAEAR